METIAIIDDDIYIGDMLEKVLKKEGYGTLRAYSGTEACMLLERSRPDLILLDLMLPGLSGEEVLERIHGIPVIVVSAKVEVSDKVNLLLHGACDYLTKPFDIQELLARITVRFRERKVMDEKKVLRWKELEMDVQTHESWVSGQPVKMTRTEFAILKLLIQNPEQVVTRSVILERISRDTPDCTDNSLNVHISNLRKKLREAGGKDYIEAIWGIGFRLVDRKEKQS
ncbi:Response regulator MprA [Eubacterium plexicaudatum ASF492]|uniref:Stage 0 sporulation protein A homolog n=1 Tax=Eubacterium plexicaudatum ASF492 TaxID=1235802 RepID=N1ZSY0_9FIRM|nr:Response regulator MprA [Eubacterium plexicaudatum ASF492]